MGAIELLDRFYRAPQFDPARHARSFRHARDANRQPAQDLPETKWFFRPRPIHAVAQLLQRALRRQGSLGCGVGPIKRALLSPAQPVSASDESSLDRNMHAAFSFALGSCSGAPLPAGKPLLLSLAVPTLLSRNLSRNLSRSRCSDGSPSRRCSGGQLPMRPLALEPVEKRIEKPIEKRVGGPATDALLRELPRSFPSSLSRNLLRNLLRNLSSVVSTPALEPDISSGGVW